MRPRDFLAQEATRRGCTIPQLLDQFLREDEAYQTGWNEALASVTNGAAPTPPPAPPEPPGEEPSMDQQVKDMAAKIKPPGTR